MTKAILKGGVFRPIGSLPADWTDGTEVDVEIASPNVENDRHSCLQSRHVRVILLWPDTEINAARFRALCEIGQYMLVQHLVRSQIRDVRVAEVAAGLR